MNTIYIKRGLSFCTGLAFFILVLSACGSNGKPAEAKTEEIGHEDHEGGLELSAEQIKAVGIEIGGIEQKNLTEVVKSSGQLAVPPQNAAQINVLSGGIIRQINVIEGQRVRKGQVLVTVENQDLIRVQQEYLAAKDGFSYVEAEYSRQQQLKAANAGTGRSHQLAEANYNAERSKVKALGYQLQQYGISVSKLASGIITTQIPVSAPINGTIGKISAETGSYAQPGVAIMDIVDNSKIHADLIVFEKDLSQIKVGQKVDFQLTNQKNEQISGEIYGINKSFENDSKGVVVHVVIKKPGANLIPGMYVTGLIGVGTVLSNAVPVDAVIRAEGRSFIFVVDEKEEDAHEEGHAGAESIHFKKIEVSTGVTELGYIQLTALEKLPVDVKVVTKGAFYLQSKSSGPSEHSH
ncbi:MAG: efflux RND transporter periplasmic adaptor subunit [Pedobacter sp.]|nr:MAG: efflux RND transporter periplasmic adaptor subunit [Pedobacter sp.]